MKNLGFVFAAVVMIGCGSDTTPTASGVFPASAFLGRNVRVEVSGDATNWKDGATVSFGPDVTVNSVDVSSPTSLFADITVKDNGAPGLNDVVVTDSGKSFTMTQAFELKPAVSFSSSQGTMAQGSVAFITIQNHDFDTPFDPTTDANGSFVNTVINGPTGTTFQINTVDAFSISAAMLMDTDAASGDLSVVSGVPGMTTTSSLGQNVTIAARTATALTTGPNTGTESEALGTQLFDFTPSVAGPLAATAIASTTNTDANPMMIVLTSSGKFSDGFEIFPVTGFFGDVIKPGLSVIEGSPEKLFVIYWDNTGSSGYQFSIDTNAVTLAPANEVATANNTQAQAQAYTMKNVLLNNGTLSDVHDIDFVKIPVAAGDVGKKVHVITQGDPLTDTLVEVFAGSAGTTSLGVSSDADFQEDFTSAAIPSGTPFIFVKVSASQQGFFDPGHNQYVMGAFLE